MTERIFHLTPPLRQAIVDLALAYSDWQEAPMPSVPSMAVTWTKLTAERLLDAQDVLGIELVKRDRLLPFLLKEAA